MDSAENSRAKEAAQTTAMHCHEPTWPSDSRWELGELRQGDRREVRSTWIHSDEQWF